MAIFQGAELGVVFTFCLQNMGVMAEPMEWLADEFA